MSQSPAHQKILAFLNQNTLGVISTIHVDKNAPESAVVGFGNTENLELVFGTLASTRKYKNLMINPNLSFVIGWSSTTGTLQYEGVAHELSAEEIEKYTPLLLSKSEGHKKFINHPEQKYFLVTPTWIRFSDNAGNPPEVYELTP